MRTTPASGGEKMRKMIMQRARDGGGMRGAVRRCATGGPILSNSDVNAADANAMSRTQEVINNGGDPNAGIGEDVLSRWRNSPFKTPEGMLASEAQRAADTFAHDKKLAGGGNSVGVRDMLAREKQGADEAQSLFQQALKRTAPSLAPATTNAKPSHFDNIMRIGNALQRYQAGDRSALDGMDEAAGTGGIAPFTPSFAEGGILSRVLDAIKGRKALLDGAGEEEKAPPPPPAEKEETSDEMMKRMMKEVGDIRKKGPVMQYAEGGRMGAAVKKVWDAREGGPVPQGEEEGIDKVPALTSAGIVRLDAPSENADENEYALTPEMVRALGGVEKLELLRAALADVRGESLRERKGRGEDGLPGYAKAGPIDGDIARDLDAGDAKWQIPLRPLREAAVAGAVPELNAENVKEYLAPLRAEAQQHEKDIQAEGGIGEAAKRIMAGHQADAQRSVLAKAAEVQAQVNAANAGPHSGFSLRTPDVALPEIQQPGITGAQSIALQNVRQEQDWAPEDRQMKMSEMRAAIEEKKAQAAKARREAEWGFSTEETTDPSTGIITKRTIPTSIESMKRKEAEAAAPPPFSFGKDIADIVRGWEAAGPSPTVIKNAQIAVKRLRAAGRNAEADAIEARFLAKKN